MDDRLKEGERLLFIGGKRGEEGPDKGVDLEEREKGGLCRAPPSRPRSLVPCWETEDGEEKSVGQKNFWQFPRPPLPFPLLP